MSDRDHSHDHNNNINLAALVAGALMGAAAVYLLGTEKGRKLKDELLEEGQKLLDKIGDEVDHVHDQIEDHQDEIKGKLAEGIEKVEETVEDLELGRRAEGVVKTIEDVPQHIAAVQKKGRKFFFHRSHPHHTAES